MFFRIQPARKNPFLLGKRTCLVPRKFWPIADAPQCRRIFLASKVSSRKYLRQRQALTEAHRRPAAGFRCEPELFLPHPDRPVVSRPKPGNRGGNESGKKSKTPLKQRFSTRRLSAPPSRPLFGAPRKSRRQVGHSPLMKSRAATPAWENETEIVPRQPSRQNSASARFVRPQTFRLTPLIMAKNELMLAIT